MISNIFRLTAGAQQGPANAYDFYDWIKGTTDSTMHNARIVLPLCAKNNVGYELTYKSTPVDYDVVLFGARADMNTQSRFFYDTYYTHHGVGIGAFVQYGTIYDSEKYTIRFNYLNSRTFECGGSIFHPTFPSDTVFAQNYPLCAFSYNRAEFKDDGTITGTAYPMYGVHTEMTFYSIKLTEGSTLKYDLIPAKRKSDNRIGLYCQITGNFYSNNGWDQHGNLEVGND